MKKIFLFTRGSRGQSAVEFAVVTPVLLLFLMGCIIFGNVFYRTLLVNEAARAAVRAVAVGGQCSAAVKPAGAFGTVSGVTIQATTVAGVQGKKYTLSPTSTLPQAGGVLTPSCTVTVGVTQSVYVGAYLRKFFDPKTNTASTWTFDPTDSNRILVTGNATMRLEVYPNTTTNGN